eukprot:TRINITY_DN17790_c2_g2_i4.p1 TRINITY_DN17790_c2_g2~~TRINITY_DN17790_c2_g2_i4.p1  ORF type:complete len:502 (-),score=66.56 TRINITY_DN17790_c2_g2_i4:231-1736(-)
MFMSKCSLSRALPLPYTCSTTGNTCSIQVRTVVKHSYKWKLRSCDSLVSRGRNFGVRAQSSENVKQVTDECKDQWIWQESKDALRAYTLLAGVLLLGTIPQFSQFSWAPFPYFITLASLTIYIGAHRGLTSKERQVISLKQGVFAPVLASVTLFGGYLLIKFFPNLSPQAVIDAYFWFIGSVAIAGAAQSVLQQIGGPLAKQSIVFNIPKWLLEEENDNAEVKSSPLDFVSLAIGIGLATIELVSHHSYFTLSNMVACLVAADIMGLIGLKSFRVATVLLFGLLFYDVFWVFASPTVVGENVMLTVATSDMLQGPTRLMFPKALGSGGEAASFPFAILGLGDVAVPGLLGCLALRFDGSRAVDFVGRARSSATAMGEALKNLPIGVTDKQAVEEAADAAEQAFEKFADQEQRQREGSNEDEVALPVSELVMEQRNYFAAVMVAYNVGLTMAFTANNITGLGQPALLYLVPCTLLAVILLSINRKEFRRVWTFDDKGTTRSG